MRLLTVITSPLEIFTGRPTGVTICWYTVVVVVVVVVAGVVVSVCPGRQFGFVDPMKGKTHGLESRGGIV